MYSYSDTCNFKFTFRQHTPKTVSSCLPAPQTIVEVTALATNQQPQHYKLCVQTLYPVHDTTPANMSEIVKTVHQQLLKSTS